MTVNMRIFKFDSWAGPDQSDMSLAHEGQDQGYDLRPVGGTHA